MPGTLLTLGVMLCKLACMQRRTFRILILRVLSYLFVTFIFAVTIPMGHSLDLIYSREIALSEDQSSLVDAFGYPDIFTIIAKDGHRLEVWTYSEWERSFSFMNGYFQDDKYYKKIPDNFAFPQVRPTQFKIGMSENDIRALFDRPTATGELLPIFMEDVQLYDYYDQIKIGFKDSKLFYVQTLPVQVK